MADPGVTSTFLLRDAGLLTQQKCASFTRQQANFQNSLLRAPDESILPLPELVRSCLLLVQGIPTAGVFELDQQAFTFSANNGLKLYLE